MITFTVTIVLCLMYFSYIVGHCLYDIVNNIFWKPAFRLLPTSTRFPRRKWNFTRTESKVPGSFRKMSGTKITQFEGHLAEIMWSADVKLDLYEGFFRHLRSVYHLNGPPEYHYRTPLVRIWTGMAHSSNSQLHS